jgi:predicted glycosyltransferase
MSAKKTTASKSSKPKATRSRATAPAGDETKVGKGIFYIVYVDSYVSDDEILPKGVYRSSKTVERLDRSEARYVRRFEGAIPAKLIHEIAETLKVSVSDDNGEYRKSEDILEELVNDLD